MQMKTSLGFLILLTSSIGILANILVFRPVFKLAKNPQKSSIYVISLFNILADIVNLCLIAFYLAPCIIFESYIVGEINEEGIPKFMGFLALLIWYTVNMTQIVMATNRFVFDHEIISFNYARKPDFPNYSGLSDLPLNVSSTIIAFFCYLSIIYKIHNSNKNVLNIVSSTAQKLRRNKEFTYAMQFFSISIFYTFAWVFLRVFPVLLGDQNVQWFVLVTVCVIINSSANAIIYLISNHEIIDMIKNRRASIISGSSIERKSNNF